MRSITSALQNAFRLCLVLGSLLLPQMACGQSDTRTVVAAPKPQGANPFRPARDNKVRLPVSLQGFCVVTLREQQEWQLGSESNQLVFDGQLYWFASQRERAMFAANPQRYVPALGGDSVVAFAESGVRKPGDPRFGSLQSEKLYFFRGQAEQELFQSNPQKYDDSDLANEGFCLVSQTDDSRRLPGMPETTTIVNGLRYLFAGVHQQRKFLANMERYGVEPKYLPQTQPIASSPKLSPLPGEPVEMPQEEEVDELTVADIKNKAMSGYCPVSIRNNGTWVAGSARYRVEFDGQTYLLAGESEQKLFLKDPSTYLPALGGHCVVTEIDENRRVPGSIYHAAMHAGENRLFLFAGPVQKEAFNLAPDKYLQADLVVKGHCIVTLIDEGREVAGLPELQIWHQGKRHLFASEAMQEKFSKNTERYQGH